jgi:diguanylate cyclase (GGDEF)-like protein
LADFVDAATGVFFEEAFQHLLNRETGRATRYQDFFTLCLVRPDGREAGGPSREELESAISEKIPQFVRSTDMVGRLRPGIGIVLLHTTGDDAVRVADRIRADIEHVTFRDRAAGRPRHLTISIGEVSFPQHGHDRQTLLNRAAACLGQATERGGNRVVYASNHESAEGSSGAPVPRS